MSDVKTSTDRLEQVRELFRELEAYPMSDDPDLARTYAGQWVVIHRGRVVAHGKKGSDLIEAGYARELGARLVYVPTPEEAAEVRIGVRVLKGSGQDG
jgi:ABC-type cobalamin/Fe3+-siderophores transport system ATPase subunit